MLLRKTKKNLTIWTDCKRFEMTKNNVTCDGCITPQLIPSINLKEFKIWT